MTTHLAIRTSLRQRGSLLTEVLIALALLIPVVVLVAGLFPYSFSVDRKAWSHRTAQSLARSALEQARGQKFEDLVSFNGSHIKDGTTYSVVVTVPPVAPNAREKEVTCEVRWPVKNGEEKLIAVSRVAKLYQGQSQ